MRMIKLSNRGDAAMPDQDSNRRFIFRELRKKRFKAALADGSRIAEQVVLVIVIAVCIFGISLYHSQRAKQDALNESLRIAAREKAAAAAKAAAEEKENEETEEADPEEDIREYISPIDFSVTAESNDDIYAWMRIPGTNVDYPLLQSGEGDPEDFYLDHNVDRSAGYPGCVYSQLFNSKDFSDPVTIFYGHNMKNGTIFATLHRYEDQSFFDENPYIFVYTPEQELVYAVYASYYYSDKLIPYYFNYFGNESDFTDYLTEIETYGSGDSDHIRDGIEPDASSHIITLSTCNATGSARYLVQGVLIDYLGEGAIDETDLAKCDQDLLDGWREAEEALEALPVLE